MTDIQADVPCAPEARGIGTRRELRGRAARRGQAGRRPRLRYRFAQWRVLAPGTPLRERTFPPDSRAQQPQAAARKVRYSREQGLKPRTGSDKHLSNGQDAQNEPRRIVVSGPPAGWRRPGHRGGGPMHVRNSRNTPTGISPHQGQAFWGAVGRHKRATHAHARGVAMMVARRPVAQESGTVPTGPPRMPFARPLAPTRADP